MYHVYTPTPQTRDSEVFCIFLAVSFSFLPLILFTSFGHDRWSNYESITLQKMCTRSILYILEGPASYYLTIVRSFLEHARQWCVQVDWWT
jgi:hypothetical protein